MSVLLLIAAVLLFGWAFRIRPLVLITFIFGMWLAAIAVLELAPQGHLARAIGGKAEQWFLGGVIVLLVIGYRMMMKRVHHRARAVMGPGMADHQIPDAPPPHAASLSDNELTRYARHIVLREIGGPGQGKLRKANVLIVGAGGLGAPLALYLAAAGVGRITIADDDTVSLSNLQRQIIFRGQDIDRPKVDAAADALHALNPHVDVTPLNRQITAEDGPMLRGFDVVLDGTDTYAARAAVNAAAVAAGVPLVGGSIVQWEGQITVWDPARGAPCLACIFPEAPAEGLAPSCAEAGVVGALPGVVGSMMALEAIKIITGAGQPLRGQMTIFDGLWGETRTIRMHRRADCPVCGVAKGGAKDQL